MVESLEQRMLLSRYGEVFSIADPAGSSAVAWADDGTSVIAHVRRTSLSGFAYAQRFDAAGEAVGQQIDLGVGELGHLDLAAFADGGFVVVSREMMDQGVFCRVFAANGDPVSEAFRVDDSLGDSPSVAVSPDGGFVVTYTDSGYVYLRRFDAKGSRIGQAMNLGVARTDHRRISLAVASDGSVLVAWHDDGQVSATLVNSSGSVQSRITVAAGYRPSVVALSGGLWAIGWDSGDNVYLRVYDQRRQQLRNTLLVSEQAMDVRLALSASNTVRVAWQSASGIRATSYSADAQERTQDITIVSDGGIKDFFELAADRTDGEWLAIRGGNYEPLVGIRFGPGTSLRAIPRDGCTVPEGGQDKLWANADFVPGQTITAWEWDLDYDGSSFNVDRTGAATIFSAQSIDGPATVTVGLRVRADDGSISNIATTTVRVTNVAPTATFSAGGTVEPRSAGTVSFSNATDASLADRNAGFTYSYDFNNDGTFEITSSRERSATVPASYLANPGSYTLRGRITDKNGGSRSYTTTLKVAPVPPTALFSTGGPVTLGAAGSVSFTQVHDSPGDLAAGFTYSYDLNNDGVYETSGSSPVAQIPATILSTLGKQTVRGRIADRFGASSEYSAELRVTVPPDYFPTISGMSWNYAGVINDDAWTASASSAFETRNAEQLFVYSLPRLGSSVSQHDKFYYRIDGGLIGQVYQTVAFDSYIGDFSTANPTMSGVFSQPVGWSMSWEDVATSGSYVGNTSTISAEMRCDITQRVVSIEPLQVGSIRFTEAMRVEVTDWGTKRYVLPDVIEDDFVDAKRTSWYVRGLGLVKEEDSAKVDWTSDEGGEGTVDEKEHFELTSIPEWAKYTTLTNGILQINGTGISDNIRFEAGATDLTVYRNGLPETVPYAGLTGIVINALDGDDRIDLSALSFPATITGGAGNDTITGGTGADLIYGGDGDDVLSAGAGSDTIYGNFGDDVIMGGLQRDSIMGGWGDDTITAGDGPDSVYGGNGRDLIRGGKGADYVEGKGKSDTIYGGVGNDTLHGNAGDDLIYAEDGDDRVFVNDGELLVFRDTVYAGAGADVIDRDTLDSVLDDEVEVLA